MQPGAARLENSGEGVAVLLAAVERAAPGHPMLAALRGLDWAASLPNRAAPGYVYLAGAVGGSPVGGGGRDLAEAALRLAGEAAEAVAQAAPPEITALPGDPDIDATWCRAAAPTRIAGIALGEGVLLGLPAAAVHSSPALDAERAATAPPRSLGLAAGTSRAAARLAGLLELIERDAAAGWWLGGARPRAVEATALAGVAEPLGAMRRGGVPARGTTILALESEAEVPVACALSREPDGRGLAFGLKAALDMAEAARGAVIEMLQMEIALEMARHRGGSGQPTEGDRGALARAALDADALAAFAALPAPAAAPEPAGLPDLLAALGRRGIRAAAADLAGAPAGFHVAKVFAAGLRPLPGGGLRAAAGSPGEKAGLMG
jgi:ribosomal protein S12 methylthiotransferase accessory factor YcaO